MRQRIAAGEWAIGHALPTLADLAEHYQVARGTVSRVLRRLADDGLIRIVPRWGVFRRSELPWPTWLELALDGAERHGDGLTG